MSAQSCNNLRAALATKRCLANDIFDVVVAACLRVRSITCAARPVVRSTEMVAVKSTLHLAMFCRPLIAGQVKTRLIPAYGVEGSTHIYSQLVERTLRTVAGSGATASLWVAGDTTHPSVNDWSHRYSLPVHPQCHGDLGERMLNCLATLAERHARVLLIGTDCAALTVDVLQAAAAALSETCHWVFTPAEDGGYVLVGSNAPSQTPFTNIAWSTSRVMAQTRAALKATALTWAETATLWDVDEAIDVQRACAAGLITTP
jgi:uncharacterized protein